ncbi:unnamed protein product [Thelazia callipaeda]|uniref:Transmembrane protein n=1 Tax=Thelazia callipaeda TaxID=103827 RepID=A0A0N5CZQ5_THECL|nr:unnamed protein product [Thelazia callipaeda]
MVKIDLNDEPGFDPELNMEHELPEEPMLVTSTAATIIPSVTHIEVTGETVTQLTTTKESMKDVVVNFVGDKAKTLTDIARKKVMEKTGLPEWSFVFLGLICLTFILLCALLMIRKLFSKKRHGEKKQKGLRGLFNSKGPDLVTIGKNKVRQSSLSDLLKAVLELFGSMPRGDGHHDPIAKILAAARKPLLKNKIDTKVCHAKLYKMGSNELASIADL